ncbi:Protein of unknown function [Gryllus bimaculatus]|nr:Protein of unknown function [Gryllus bimaculatus]
MVNLRSVLHRGILWLTRLSGRAGGRPDGGRFAGRSRQRRCCCCCCSWATARSPPMPQPLYQLTPERTQVWLRLGILTTAMRKRMVTVLYFLY